MVIWLKWCLQFKVTVIIIAIHLDSIHIKINYLDKNDSHCDKFNVQDKQYFCINMSSILAILMHWKTL